MEQNDTVLFGTFPFQRRADDKPMDLGGDVQGLGFFPRKGEPEYEKALKALLGNRFFGRSQGMVADMTIVVLAQVPGLYAPRLVALNDGQAEPWVFRTFPRCARSGH